MNLWFNLPFLPLQLSHLYSMFAKQVQAYCKDQTVGDATQCKNEMMLYGVVKLGSMDESHLDEMDPYQRNANNIRECRPTNINPCQLTSTHDWSRTQWVPKHSVPFCLQSIRRWTLNRGRLRNSIPIQSWLTFFTFIGMREISLPSWCAPLNDLHYHHHSEDY